MNSVWQKMHLRFVCSFSVYLSETLGNADLGSRLQVRIWKSSDSGRWDLKAKRETVFI